MNENPSSPAPASLDEIAARMFPNSPGAPLEREPEHDPQAEAMFSKTFRDSALRESGQGGPPEVYNFSIPPGLEHLGLQADEDAAVEFSVLARKHGLSQAKAQELVNYHLTRLHGRKGV